ncbi:YtxH domain-containing protein [Metabacillus sp. HB246100]|uniref:YtxH domain-containing protein n=1 Tax=Bacillus weihaiensis TaxID=1547283 RepID=UPI00235648A5|nr:YtxH domain-containing protein [Bacillus weihaiensis]
MTKKKNGNEFIVGTVVGGLIGAAAALFLAPKSGKEMREDLGHQANVMKERTGQFTNEALEKTSDFRAVAKEKTSSLSQVVTEQSSQIMNKVRDLTNQSSTSEEQAEIAKQEIESALDELTEKQSPVTEEQKQDELDSFINEDDESRLVQEVGTADSTTEEPVKPNA